MTREEAKKELITGATPQQDFWHKLLSSLVFQNDNLRKLFVQFATHGEALDGIVDKKSMTPLRVKQVIDTLKDGVSSDGDTLKKLRDLIQSLEDWKRLLEGNDDTDTIINTIEEMKKAFEGLPEGAGKVLELLNKKADTNHTHTPSEVGLNNLPNAKTDGYLENNSNKLATGRALYLLWNRLLHGNVLNNMNADKLDGQHGSYYRNVDNMNAGTLHSDRLPTIPLSRIPHSKYPYDANHTQLITTGGVYALYQRVNQLITKISGATGSTGSSGGSGSTWG